MPQGPFGQTIFPVKNNTFRVRDLARTVYASTTTLWAIFASATLKVKIRKIKIYGRATAVAVADVGIVKRAAVAGQPLITGGSSIALNPYYDSGAPAPTATVWAITAAPTYGVLEQGVDAGMLFLNAGGAFTAPGLIFDFSEESPVDPTRPPILEIGANEMLEINLGTWTTAAGNLFDVAIEWTESAT